MGQFYSEKFLNYISETSDKEGEYTEIITDWLLDNIELFDNIKPITREKNYKVKTHDGIIKNEKSNREEEMIAMKLFDFSQNQGKVFDIIGKIIDYQTPLKNVRGDKAGKIDLLAYNENENENKIEKTLRILELKRPDSEETMLRCVLEAYTYLKVVDKDKLLKDFELPEDTILKTCPFVFVDGAQYKEIQEDRKYLKELMKKLDVEPIYLKEKMGNMR